MRFTETRSVCRHSTMGSVEDQIVKLPIVYSVETQIARFMGPTWGPPGFCWPKNLAIRELFCPHLWYDEMTTALLSSIESFYFWQVRQVLRAVAHESNVHKSRTNVYPLSRISNERVHVHCPFVNRRQCISSWEDEVRYQLYRDMNV